MSEATVEAQTAKAQTAEAVQYLTFRLGGEVFGQAIEKVREVLDYPAVTRVPRMPEFMQGVINLRGSVVPVVDLRMRFGMRGAERTVNTCIIIAEVAVDDGGTVVGLIADAVEEVVALDAGSVKPAPRIGNALDTSFIGGIGSHHDRFITLLAIDRLFTHQEIDAASSAA